MDDRSGRRGRARTGLLVVLAGLAPAVATAQTARAASARARVVVRVVRGPQAATDSAVRQVMAGLLAPRRGRPGSPFRLARHAAANRRLAGLLAVRVETDSVARTIRMRVEYVGND